MGAQQSSEGSDFGAAHRVRKTCYYDLLEVDRLASSSEIKKAYRIKALQLHPDKNIDDYHNATRLFTEVQTAYEVLSDRHERAWYDAHRDTILSGVGESEDHADISEYCGTRLTRAEDISLLIRQFTPSVSFTDIPGSFYTVVRETFEQLALEELTFSNSENDVVNDLSYPSFGYSYSDYKTEVRPFYNFWEGFTTRKSFSWKDKYKISDAPDRRTRRLMEKDNKKLRDTCIREFNNAVRFLVTFVRKRDPRHSSHRVSEQQRLESALASSAAQSARDRALRQENLPQYEAQDWEIPHQDDATGDDFLYPSSNDEVQEKFECIACEKLFKSQNQLSAHERSKKHQKAVQYIREMMEKEDRDIREDPFIMPVESAGSERANDGINEKSNNGNTFTDAESDEIEHTEITTPNSTISDQTPEYLQPFETDDVHHVELDFERLQLVTSHPDASESADTPSGNKDTKSVQAKSKKARRALNRKDKNTITENKCHICNETFVSRNQLFAHIQKEGHAKLVTKTRNGKRV